MADNPDPRRELGEFLTRFSAPVVAIVALITSLYGFVKLFGEKDVGLVTLISLVVALLFLLGTCLYYARFWQPEQGDRNYRGFVPASREQETKQAQKEKRRKWTRRSAVVGLVLIPLLAMGSIAGWQHYNNQPSKDILILVADFDGPDAQNYFVTKTIYENLETATEPYQDVKVKRLNKIVQEKKEAREEGETQNANIVIWGAYGKTKDTVPISANFELIKKPDDLPELAPEARGKVRTAALAELESFRLQTKLSQEMTYLTLVTLGMSSYQAKDWDGAIARFTDALKQTSEPMAVLAQDAVYLYRANSLRKKEKYDEAIADYTQAIKLQPNLAKTYYNRGLAYYNKQNFDREITDYTQAIKLQPNYADAYYNRGNAYYNKQNFDEAISDYTQAIKLQPNHSDAYFNRGNVYSNKKDFSRAIADYTQAIKLQPKDANAYLNRGLTYRDKKNRQNAMKDFEQVLALTQDPDLRKYTEEELKKLGVK